ncbi:MAG: hypothetical protein KDJ38_00190 [Gammaproteobacteria bacterium]|nr:hypothetical protein [Gammaproteobacteria bacterium]
MSDIIYPIFDSYIDLPISFHALVFMVFGAAIGAYTFYRQVRDDDDAQDEDKQDNAEDATFRDDDNQQN